MTIEIEPAPENELGRVIAGVDLDGQLKDEDVTAIRESYRKCPVICLRCGELTPAQFLSLARLFGEPQVQVLRDHRHAELPQISFIPNEQRDMLGDGKRIVFGSHWHTDDSYMAVPCATTLLYGQTVPESGGDTLFANMYRAYETLPESLQNCIGSLRAVHKYQSRRNLSPVPQRTEEEAAETPDVVHPLVRTHPETGRKAIYLNANRIDRILGMPLDEGDALLDELLEHATLPEFVYRHRWHAGDVVVWDNRCTMHKASADYGDNKREMLRVLIQGSPPV